MSISGDIFTNRKHVSHTMYMQEIEDYTLEAIRILEVNVGVIA